MNRGTFIAILVGLLAASGLAFATIGSSDEPDEAPTAAGNDANGADPSASDPDATDDSNNGETAREAIAQSEPVPSDVPENFGPAGTLTDVETWLQTDATSLEEFDGQVRIVQFWTFGCFNCKNTLPHLQEIYAEHKADGLEIIGVHAPEFNHESDVDNVRRALVDLGVTWPVAIDNNKTNFRSWQTGRRFWPRTFVVDQNGDIRFDRIGEGKYAELEATVAWLLENGP